LHNHHLLKIKIGDFGGKYPFSCWKIFGKPQDSKGKKGSAEMLSLCFAHCNNNLHAEIFLNFLMINMWEYIAAFGKGEGG
jgi:hypothetical protein